MQSPFLLAVAAPLLLSGCALLGFGPPTSKIEGWVYSVEDHTPLPRAEVCALGMDTVCVRADRAGRYSLRLRQQQVVLRFRSGALPPAASDTIEIFPPQRYSVSCAISNRLVLSERPLACQPVPGR